MTGHKGPRPALISAPPTKQSTPSLSKAELDSLSRDLVNGTAGVDRRFILSCGKPDPSPCCVRRLIVRCGHGERSYVISRPGGPQVSVLEVLSLEKDDTWKDSRNRPKTYAEDDEPDHLDISLDGGPCLFGKSITSGSGQRVEDDHDCGVHAPAIVVSGPEVSVRAASPVAVNVYAPTTGGAKDAIVAFWTALTDRQKLAHRYNVSISACHEGTPDQLELTVDAYPAMSGKANLIFEYLPDTLWSKAKQIGRLREDFNLSGNMGLTIGRSTWTFLDVSTEQEGTPYFLKDTQPYLKKFFRLVSELSDGSSIKIDFPKITASMEIEANELAGSPKLDLTGALAIKAEPLLGATFEYDCLPAVVRMIGRGSAAFAGPMGPIIAEILIMAHNRNKDIKRSPLKVSLDFYIKGSVDFDCKWTLPNTVEGNFGPKPVEIGLKGGFSFEVRKLVLYTKTAFEASLFTKLGFKEMKPAVVDGIWGIQGQFYCDGLVAKYAAELSVGVGQTRPATISKPTEAPYRTDVSLAGGKTEESWRWIDPITVPAKPMFVPLYGGLL